MRQGQATWRWALTAGLLAGGLTLGGCANDARTGALIGAGTGAAAGAVIGHQSGETGEGAAVGGAVGAGAGYIIGNESDKAKRRRR
jgi:uncharacterized protein YcfJ